jgi:sigma-54 dependent transcriptional regulator, acetoin dehydrogenase operon transcriptional activator AcoR
MFSCALRFAATIVAAFVECDQHLGLRFDEMAALMAEENPVLGSLIQEVAVLDQRVAALTRHYWRPNAAAQALGMSRATLYRRIAKLGIVGPHRT